MRAGPDLFAKPYTKEYVIQVLADPERVFAALAAHLTANDGVGATP